MRGMLMLVMAVGAVAWMPASAQLEEEKSEYEIALERARYGGWPTLITFSEGGLTHADPNAALWMREDVKAALKKWAHVNVNTPPDRPPAKPIVERYKVKTFPTVLLLSWDGTEWQRWTDRVDGAVLIKVLLEKGKKARPLPDREIAYRKALYERAQKSHAKGEPSKALKGLKKLLRRRPAYQRAVEAKALSETIAAEGKAEVAKTVAVEDDKAWDKATKALRRKYSGVDLRGAIAAAKVARAKARAGGGSGSGEGSGSGAPPMDPKWARAKALELDGKWLQARGLLRGLAKGKGPTAEAAKARLKEYGTDAKIAAAIARQEKDKRCAGLKKLAENYLRNKMEAKAREALTKLKAEAPHPLADWAASKLSSLD